MTTRTLGSAILALLSIAAMTIPAAAAPGRSVCLKTQVDRAGNVVCVRRGYTTDGGSTAVAVAGSSEPDYPDWEPPVRMEWAVWLAWGQRASGAPCYYAAGQWVADGHAAAVSARESIEIELMKLWDRNGIGDPAACNSVAEIADGGPPAVPSETVLWDAVRGELPRPNPLWIAPGEAITGLPAWLETNRDLTFELPPSGLAAMPGGMVSVTAEADFTVDWGDPSPHDESDPDHAYTTEGIPPPEDISLDNMHRDHPDSIQHTYTVVPESGDAIITVTDHWTVTFEDQWGRTATVDGDLTTSETFSIIELQAVVTD